MVKRPLQHSVLRALITVALLTVGGTGCERNMYDGARLKPLEANRFFPDGQLARSLPAGSIPRETIETNAPVQSGEETLARGKERYEIFCAPCHDKAGTGDGAIVRRGFSRPVSFQDMRLRREPLGYFYEAITRGYKSMLPMNDQIPASDRWAIAGYVRALQGLSGGQTNLNANDTSPRAIALEKGGR